MILDTPEQITLFTLRVQRAAVILEKSGMKHSNGNITPRLKHHYNLPRNATYDQVIAKINEELASYE